MSTVRILSEGSDIFDKDLCQTARTQSGHSLVSSKASHRSFLRDIYDLCQKIISTLRFYGKRIVLVNTFRLWQFRLRKGNGKSLEFLLGDGCRRARGYGINPVVARSSQWWSGTSQCNTIYLKLTAKLLKS